MNIEKIVRLIGNIIVLQLVAFLVVETINPIVYKGFPYNVWGEATANIVIHIMFSVVALTFSFITYD